MFNIRLLCGVCTHQMTRPAMCAVSRLQGRIHVGCSHCHDIIFTITLSPTLPELTYVTQNANTKMTVDNLRIIERNI